MLILGVYVMAYILLAARSAHLTFSKGGIMFMEYAVMLVHQSPLLVLKCTALAS
jgi:hypothetical protein